MPRKKTPEELRIDEDRCERAVEKAIGRFDYYLDMQRNMEKIRPEYDRKARTHRLCSRGGRLEQHLREPELLTDDQVSELLTLCFAHDDVQQALARMISEAYERPDLVQL